MTHILRPDQKDKVRVRITESAIELHIQSQQDTFILELEDTLAYYMLETLSCQLQPDAIQLAFPF